MKKFLMFIFITALIFVACLFLATKTDVLSAMSSNLEMIGLGFLKEEIPYGKDFVINNLGKIEDNTYYYDKLDETQKKIYTSIANSVKDLDKEAMIRFDREYDFTGVSDDIKNAMESFFADHPEVFYLNTKYQILTNTSLFGNMAKIYLSYSVTDKEDLDSKISEINLKLDEYGKDIINSDTDYDKELKLHDKIASEVSYYAYSDIEEIPEEYHTLYGAINKKSVVCDGFSKLYQMALAKNGVRSIIVTGVLDSAPHAWNMVFIDGNWYNVDLTSDKTIKDYSNAIVHSYFNITTEEMKETHKFFDENILPNADSKDANYYIRENKYISAGSNFNTQLEKMLKTNENDVLLEIKVDSEISSVPEKIVKKLSDRSYPEYIDKTKNAIQYYNILNTYVIMKK